jgi:hypothetical protein
LAAIAAAGFRGVEICENDLLSFDGTPAEVANRFIALAGGRGYDASGWETLRDVSSVGR